MAKTRCPQCSSEFERTGDFCPQCGYALTFVKELEEEPAEQYSERLPGEVPPPPPVKEPEPEPVVVPVVEEPTPVPAYAPPPAEVIVVPPPPPAPRRTGLPIAAIVVIAVVVLALIGGGIWAVLGRQTAEPAHSTGEPTQSAQPSEAVTPAEPELALGDRELYVDPAAPLEGTDVMRLQSALLELGFYDGEASGTFDEATASGVRLFQQAAGLAVDGRVTADVAAAVLAALERGATLAEVDPATIQASASSALPPDGDKTYSAANTLDGNLSTAWNEDAPGKGEGEWISYAFTSPIRLGRIDITNGYTKSNDVYAWNARVREMIVVTDQGEFTFTLADTQSPQMLIADFGETGSVTLKIVSVYPGTKYEDCAITDVQFWSAH